MTHLAQLPRCIHGPTTDAEQGYTTAPEPERTDPTHPHAPGPGPAAPDTMPSTEPAQDEAVRPVAIVIPYDGQPNAGEVARNTEAAVHCGDAARPVFTVVVGTARHDARVAGSWGLTLSCHSMNTPAARWQSQVVAGIRWALDLGAGTVVIADPQTPANEGPLTDAVSMVGGRVGAVCSPLLRPWWHQLLAIHVLRPLLGAAIGMMPRDPCARTLVLSEAVAARAARDAHRPASLPGPGTQDYPHGLGLLAAARAEGTTITQSAPRTPMPGAIAERPLLDWSECRTLIPAALDLCRGRRPLTSNRVLAWVPDTDMDSPPPQWAVSDAQELITRLLTEGAGAAGVMSAWPDPLQQAWNDAGTYTAHDSTERLNQDAALLAGRYLQRLRVWLPQLGHGYDGQAHSSVLDAALQFFRHTGTRIDFRYTNPRTGDPPAATTRRP